MGRKINIFKEKIVQLAITIDESILDKVEIVLKQRGEAGQVLFCCLLFTHLKKGYFWNQDLIQKSSVVFTVFNQHERFP
jgi:hypothetical protein